VKWYPQLDITAYKSLSRRGLRKTARVVGPDSLLSLLSEQEIVEKTASECANERKSDVEGKYPP
jgi:hypothetical protein